MMKIDKYEDFEINENNREGINIPEDINNVKKLLGIEGIVDGSYIKLNTSRVSSVIGFSLWIEQYFLEATDLNINTKKVEISDIKYSLNTLMILGNYLIS